MRFGAAVIALALALTATACGSSRTPTASTTEAATATTATTTAQPTTTTAPPPTATTATQTTTTTAHRRPKKRVPYADNPAARRVYLRGKSDCEFSRYGSHWSMEKAIGVERNETVPLWRDVVQLGCTAAYRERSGG